jgi:ribonuclease HI
MGSLKEHLGITTERFASPMDRSPHMTQYWSTHPEDQLFGSNHDALSVAWTGPSQAHMGLDAEACEKGMRWAINSAEAYPDTPTCTIMVVPFAKGDPHMKHLQHRYTKIIAHMENNDKKPMQFLPPRQWERGGEEQNTRQQHPRTMIVVAIANATGREKYLTEENVTAFQQSWGRELPELMFGTYATKDDNYTVKSPHALGKLLQKKEDPLTPQPRASNARDPAQIHAYECYFLLCAPLEGAVYTDGSCIKVEDGQQCIGAAVFIQKHGITIHVNPNGKGPTKTITRAELSATHITLTHPDAPQPHEDIHLYTDSACSMHMIRRIMDAPWTLRESKHFQLLNNILDALRTRAEAGGQTYIYKVRSHTGVAGNEAADVGAVYAAKNPNKTNTTEHSENDPYSKRTWAAHVPTKAKAGAPGPAEEVPLRYVSSLRDGIKKSISQETSGGATANTGIYDTSWSEAIPAMHKPSSFNFWKDSQIPHRLKKLTFKARWGHLWNRKLAHRYGLAPNPNCPMCGQPDSTGHLLGGCQHPEARGITILRHDQAVAMIQKTISTSSMGGYFTIMDAGAASDLPEDVQGKRLPAWLFPSTATYSEAEIQAQEALRLRLRPDILVVEGLTAQAARGTEDAIRRILPYCKIHIFEVGYCRDTDHKQKDDDKQEQHAQLEKLLRSYGRTALYHPPITLGRTGTIPSSLIKTLRDIIGLTAPKADVTAKALARHAIRYLDKLYTHRQVHEATLKPTGNNRRKDAG